MAALSQGLMGQQQRQQDSGPALGEVLRPELLAPLLRQEGTLERLAEFLPLEHR